MATSICASLRAGVATTSAAAMRDLAAAFARELPPDTVLALHGNLGAGKTTFIQGLAAGLGVVEPVTSPTFTLFNLHQGSRARLLHLDAYRLERDDQMDELMLEDFLVSPWIMAIEWPERVAGWLPATARHLDLAIDEGQRHVVQLRA